MNGDRERGVTEAFVSIANSLVDGYDIVDLYCGLTADCARLLDVASAGLLLADGGGVLHVMAASSESARDLELLQLQREQGPCLDCYRDGVVVLVPDLGLEHARWPLFVAAATAAGFASVHAVPMRLQDTVLGSLNLFGTEVGALNAEDLSLAQAFAHVASVALIAGKSARDKDTINAQLQSALTSRVVLEQAKGVLSHLGKLDIDQAFAVLRLYARDHNQRLTDVAQAVVSDNQLAQQVIAHARAKGPRATKV